METTSKIDNRSWFFPLSRLVWLSTLMAFPFGILEADVYGQAGLAESD